MIGRLLDRRYQVVQVLGQGGFGHTYTAQDTRRPGNPTCVVKHLQPATSDPDFLHTARRLFKREAEALENLGSHDRIPRLLAYFEEDEEFYLVQEFIPGNPLSLEMQPGEFWSESRVIELLQEVLSILEFVHSHQVIHRDLKPQNLIRRSSDNKLVLVDFGAVKQVQIYSAMTPEQLKNETVPIGTPGYMPLEQAQGRPRPCSDIYALGTIAIQALTGLNPKQLGEEPVSGEISWQHRAQVSEPLAAILTKMVRQYYKYRYQSASEVLEALASVVNPNTPAAVAVIFSQMLRSYLREGYVSASKIVRSLQEVAKSGDTHTQDTTVPQPYSDSATTIPPLSPQADNTITIAPVNKSASPGNVPWSRSKLPLLIAGSSAIIMIGIGIIGVTRLQSDSVTAQNKIQETTDKNKNPAKNSCFVVVRPTNVRSLSGRRKTGTVIPAGTKVTSTGKEENGWLEISSPESGWIWKGRTKNTCPGK
ncbi:MAG: serine/threonine-protein kinase [Nostocaceae cyanobacterium]|nr:serine/threonine-protein kinase [Nostocaceae cyanobacterium]